MYKPDNATDMIAQFLMTNGITYVNQYGFDTNDDGINALNEYLDIKPLYKYLVEGANIIIDLINHDDKYYKSDYEIKGFRVDYDKLGMVAVIKEPDDTVDEWDIIEKLHDKYISKGMSMSKDTNENVYKSIDEFEHSRFEHTLYPNNLFN